MKKSRVIEFLSDWAIMAVLWLVMCFFIVCAVLLVFGVIGAILETFGLWSLLGLVPIIGALIQVIWYWITED